MAAGKQTTLQRTIGMLQDDLVQVVPQVWDIHWFFDVLVAFVGFMAAGIQMTLQCTIGMLRDDLVQGVPQVRDVV